MRLKPAAGGAAIALDQGPEINFCRPAVDPMFETAARKFIAAALLAAILTGMGSDGANGGRAIAAAGGAVIAQDEDTSVVWGMPGAAASLLAFAALYYPWPKSAPKLIHCSGEDIMTSEQFNFLRSLS